jgi:hypothetical protein
MPGYDFQFESSLYLSGFSSREKMVITIMVDIFAGIHNNLYCKSKKNITKCKF